MFADVAAAHLGQAKDELDGTDTGECEEQRGGDPSVPLGRPRGYRGQNRRGQVRSRRAHARTHQAVDRRRAVQPLPAAGAAGQVVLNQRPVRRVILAVQLGRQHLAPPLTRHTG
jgi:hypothetical protein